MLTKYPYKKWASLSGLQTRSKRMGAFIDKWREITSDPEILNIVLVSKIPLRCKPVQNAHLMDVELESPCKRRHSTSLPHKRGLFPLSIPSPQKGWSLSACKMPGFPKNVRGEHFQTQNISLLKFLLQRGDFMNILDIKAHTCRSRPQGLSKVYIVSLKKQMLCLSRPLFWLKYCSKGFYQTLKTSSSLLKQRSVRMILCLDNFVILSSSFPEVQQHTPMVVPLLELLGFKVNQKKSCLIPTQVIKFLSFVIDSTVETLRLPEEKVVKMKSICKKAILSTTLLAHQLASLLGTLESCRLASKLLFPSGTCGFS